MEKTEKSCSCEGTEREDDLRADLERLFAVLGVINRKLDGVGLQLVYTVEVRRTIKSLDFTQTKIDYAIDDFRRELVKKGVLKEEAGCGGGQETTA